MLIADAVTAVQDWAVEQIPALAGYDYPASVKTQPLPDIGVEPTEIADSIVDEEFPELANLQQRDFRVLTMRLLLIADPTDERAASQSLWGYIDTLTTAVRDDTRVGVESGLMVSRRMRASFDPPFVKYDDNTVGRAAWLYLKVATEV